MFTGMHKPMTMRTAAVAGAIILLAAGASLAQQGHIHRTDVAPNGAATAVDKSFARLLRDAMETMDRGMRDAPMTGVPEHDFVAMMIPHHQGAIDMAKALLLTTKDPELLNLAQGIVTEQETEIRLMRAWLDRNAERRR